MRDVEGQLPAHRLHRCHRTAYMMLCIVRNFVAHVSRLESGAKKMMRRPLVADEIVAHMHCDPGASFKATRVYVDNGERRFAIYRLTQPDKLLGSADFSPATDIEAVAARQAREQNRRSNTNDYVVVFRCSTNAVSSAGPSDVLFREVHDRLREHAPDCNHVYFAGHGWGGLLASTCHIYFAERAPVKRDVPTWAFAPFFDQTSQIGDGVRVIAFKHDRACKGVVRSGTLDEETVAGSRAVEVMLEYLGRLGCCAPGVENNVCGGDDGYGEIVESYGPDGHVIPVL